ncbi:MAG TPA: hypothetical protein VL949_14325 [Geobacteraceae bacterium]|jgi:hypothetical protein|nr:hypothetical protein [Geobacteraceae bacterium]
MNNNASIPADRRQHPHLRKFVRFEFIAYIILHVYTCYVILEDYGLMFAVIAAICPVIPEIYMFVMGIYTRKIVYVSVFLIFVVLVIINVIAANRRDRAK